MAVLEPVFSLLTWNICTPHDLATAFLGMYATETYTYTHQNTSKNVHSSYDSQNLGATHMSINSRMGKQIVMYLHKGALYGNKYL